MYVDEVHECIEEIKELQDMRLKEIDSKEDSNRLKSPLTIGIQDQTRLEVGSFHEEELNTSTFDLSKVLPTPLIGKRQNSSIVGGRIKDQHIRVIKRSKFLSFNGQFKRGIEDQFDYTNGISREMVTSNFDKTCMQFECLTVQKSPPKGYQKPPQETGLALKVLEEKINGVLEIPKEDIQLSHTIQDLVDTSPALESWVRHLSDKIDCISQRIYLQQLREIHTYNGVCKAMIEKGIGAEAFQKCFVKLSYRSPDLEDLSEEILKSVSMYVRNRKSRRSMRHELVRSSQTFKKCTKNI